MKDNDLGYLIGCQSFIPFGNSMNVLPSQIDYVVRNFEKNAQGARMTGLSSSLVFIGDLLILNTLPNCSSIGIRNKALPLKNFREGRNLHWIMCPIFDLWNMI